MNKTKEISGAISLIKNHFFIPENELQLQEETIEELQEKLSTLISNLLNRDMERLLHVFYRIDLDERVFKRILSEEVPEKISLKLAQEVIKRELQKVRTREKYKKT